LLNSANADVLEQIGAIGHQIIERSADPIPFQHCEFGRMQHSALAVTKHPCEIENAGFAGCQQLFAGKFRGCVQIKRLGPAIMAVQIDRNAVQMGFVAGRDLQLSGLDLGEVADLEPAPQSGFDSIASQQQRAAVAVPDRRPKRRNITHHEPRSGQSPF